MFPKKFFGEEKRTFKKSFCKVPPVLQRLQPTASFFVFLAFQQRKAVPLSRFLRSNRFFISPKNLGAPQGKRSPCSWHQLR